MGVMEKMRQSTGVVLWVLIFSFGILWMLQDTQVFNVLGAGPRSLGSVNGEPIKNEEYQRLIQSYSNRYSRQTGNSPTAEQRAYFQEQAWDKLVTGKLLSQKMDNLGIAVTDQEVVNMIKGEHPDPFIRKQFGKKDGSIDRAALNQAINSKQNSKVWIAIESQLRQKRRQQKMTNYIQSSMEVSQHEIKQQFMRDNTTADISYVRFPYAEVAESDINISDDDLRGYYKDHPNKFKRKETYRFEYVGFDKTPTKQDTSRTIKDVKDLRSDFTQTSSDSLFLSRYQSTTDYNDSFVKKSDVRELFRPALAKLKKGEVSPVIMDESSVYVLKKLDEKGDKIKFVVLSYQIKADPIATIDKRADSADDFKFFADQDGFEKEAKTRDLKVKKGFATKGNSFISGLGQSRQIMDVLKNAEQGTISKPIELPGQFVVLKVTEKKEAGVRSFDKVKSQIRTIVVTEKRKQQVTQKVKKLLDSSTSMQKLADASGKSLKQAKGLKMSDQKIEGAGREPEIIGAIFGLKKDKVSTPLKGTSAVFVVEVTGKTEADSSKITSSDNQKIRRKLQQEKSQVFASVWLKELKDRADIEDYRSQVLQNR